MNDKSEQAPSWVKDVIGTLPEDLEEEQLAALMLTIIAMYRDHPSDVIPLLLSLALTYSRTVGLPMDILQKSYQSAADGVGYILIKESGMMN